MNRIKILFLTFVLSLTSVGGLACWDDWDDDWDDWGCYDDWDDDDEVDDEHDDWYYNEETGDYWLYDVEVTGSNDGILMDEVVVTYDTGSDDDNDTNNEDPWSDNGDGWGNDDYGWEDGEDDYDGNSGGGNSVEDDSNKNIFPSENDIAKSLSKSVYDFYLQLKEKGKIEIQIVDASNPKIGDANARKYLNDDVAIIYIRYISYFTPDQYSIQLTQELFHIFQDVTGIMSMVNNNHSPIEYQETVMNSISTIMSGCPIGNLLGVHSSEFESWIKGIIHDNVVDYDLFIYGINQWYSDFVNAKAGAYAQDQELKYLDKIANMKWKEVLEWYGFYVETTK